MRPIFSSWVNVERSRVNSVALLFVCQPSFLFFLLLPFHPSPLPTLQDSFRLQSRPVGLLGEPKQRRPTNAIRPRTRTRREMQVQHKSLPWCMRGEGEDEKGSEGKRKQHEHAAFIWLFYLTFYFTDHCLKGTARRCTTLYMTTPTTAVRAHVGQMTIRTTCWSPH